MCGENVKVVVFLFLQNALNLGIFTHGRIRQSKLQTELCKNLFSTVAERGGENYDLLYQNSIRKYGDDLEHLYFGFLYFV